MLSSRISTLMLHVILNEWLLIWFWFFFTAPFWISTEMMYLQRCLVVTWLVPRETAAASARSVYTIQPCTVSRHFMQSHIRRVHACLAVTCHLLFWQNGRDPFTCYWFNTGGRRYSEIAVRLPFPFPPSVWLWPEGLGTVGQAKCCRPLHFGVLSFFLFFVLLTVLRC